MKKIFKVTVSGINAKEIYNVIATTATDAIYILQSYGRPNKDEYDCEENNKWREHIDNDTLSIDLVMDNIIG